MTKKIEKSLKQKLIYQKNFYSDLNTSQDMLYGLLVRSPGKKGRITSITHPRLPKDYFLCTAHDVPGENIIHLDDIEFPVFSEGNISYPGEVLALIAGPDERKLNELMADIEIVFDSEDEKEKKPVENSDDTKIYEFNTDVKKDFHSKKILEKHFEFGKDLGKTKASQKKIESIFEKCDCVIEGSYNYSLKTTSYNECCGAICDYKNDGLTVYTPSNWPKKVRQVVSKALKLDEDQILIKKTISFESLSNSLWCDARIAAQAAVASKKCSRPVKVVLSRQEEEKFIENTRPVTIVHKTGMDKNGQLKIMQVMVDLDTGAFNPLTEEILNRLIIASCGVYNVENRIINANAYSSPNPPSAIDFSQLDTAAFFAVENQLNSLASTSGFTTLELKKINVIKNSKDLNLPFKFTFEKTDLIFDTLEKQSSFNRKYSSYNLCSQLQKLSASPAKRYSPLIPSARGIGFACAFEGLGFLGTKIDSKNIFLEVTMENEKSLVIHSFPVSPAVEDTWKNIANKILGLSASQVKISNALLNDEDAFSIPNNSNLSIITSLLIKCCESIKNSNSKKYPITVKKYVSPSQKKLWNEETFTGFPFLRTSFATCAVEIEMDYTSFKEKIKGIWFVVNGGEIINAREAESAIKLKIQLVLNSLRKDEAINTDNIHVFFIQSSSPAAQISQLVYKTLPAAYTQALSQAIGNSANYLPLKNDSLYKLMTSKTSAVNVIKKIDLTENNEEKIKTDNETENLNELKEENIKGVI